jgi:hypothetical protein
VPNGVDDVTAPDGIKGAFLFETQIAMRAAANDRFTLFQIHDGRLGRPG